MDESSLHPSDVGDSESARLLQVDENNSSKFYLK